MLKIILAVVLVGLIESPGVAYAEVSRSIMTSNTPKCSNVEVAIQARVNAYTQKKLETSQALSRIDMRISNIIGRADVRGYSVHQLESDQEELRKRSKSIDANYKILLSAISDSKEKCGSPGSLSPAKLRLRTIKKDVTSLNSWIEETLLPDLRKMRQK